MDGGRKKKTNKRGERERDAMGGAVGEKVVELVLELYVGEGMYSGLMRGFEGYYLGVLCLTWVSRVAR